jgi:20S proteasome subunit alpha 4
MLTVLSTLNCYKANAIGRSSNMVREFLEKNWKPDMSKDATIQLAVKSLLEIVQTGAKNIDMAIMDGHGKVRVRMVICRFPFSMNNLADTRDDKNLTLEEIEAVVADIEKEKEAEAERKRSRLAAKQATQAAMLGRATTTGAAEGSGEGTSGATGTEEKSGEESGGPSR